MNPDLLGNGQNASPKKPLFPVLIDLSDKTVLIVSGGGLAEAKAIEYLRALSPSVGSLCVLSEKPSDHLRELIPGSDIRLLEKPYEREDLYGADLVVCTTTDPTIMDDVFAACRTLGIRLQITSQSERSDYILQLDQS